MKLPAGLNWTNLQKKIEKRDILLLGGVGFLLVFLFLYGVWYRPQIRTNQKLRRELYDLKVRRKDAEMLKDVSTFKDEIERIEGSVEKKLFKRNEIPRALESLKGQIEKAHLEAISLKPELREKLASVTLAPDFSVEVLPVELHLKGHYAAAGEFLGSLRALPFLTRVDRLQMESPSEIYPRIDLHLTLSLYLEEEGGVGRGK
ncbi:type 4a pilus biogenesis protein PilO [candidate division TA06 bacterium]|nr:type 4a pilus biogenesis protein PilO [candidate division TA06 bacterium]